MRAQLLARGCTASSWKVNAAGCAATALIAAHLWGPLPLWPTLVAAVAGWAHSTWWTGLAVAHDGWVHGWWWAKTEHDCWGDDGDDDVDAPTPVPDDPHHRHTYTLAA